MLGLFFGSLLKRAIDAATALLGVVGRYPWQCALIAALCLAGVQTWRLSTVKRNLTVAIAGRASDRAAYVTAQKEAQAKAIAAKLATEARWRAQAKEADLAHATALESARSAVDRYAAGHRVRQAVAGSCSGPVAATESGGARVSEAAATDAIMVTESDFNALNEAAIYAQSAYEWAKGLNEGR